MRVRYIPETDTLLIDLKDDPVVESEYIEGVGMVIDYNERGEIVGFEIFDWSKFQQGGEEIGPR